MDTPSATSIPHGGSFAYEGRHLTPGIPVPADREVPAQAAAATPVREGLWYDVFAVGHPVLIGKHRRYGRLPMGPRCKLCKVPFRGVGWLMRSRGWRPSPRNEDYCSVCDLFIRDYEGVADLVLPVLFTDLCNSTLIGQMLSNAEYRTRRKTYRAEVARALRRTNGFILEEAGDQVVGVFPPGLSRSGDFHAGPAEALEEAASLAVDCAIELASNTARRVQQLTGFTFGAGVHIGDVRIAAAFRPDGGGAAVEINGPPTNVAARLAGAARAGDVLVTNDLLAASGRSLDRCEAHTFPPHELKGVSDFVGVRVVRG